MRLPFLACLLALFLVATTLFAQQPPPPANPTEQQPTTQQRKSDNYSIKRDVDLVVLHATVVDKKSELVSNLKCPNFRVFEDNVEQKLAICRQEDIPVTMGLVIDNSGSMREKRAKVNAAALTLVKTSNPQDEVFVVNFNDEYYLDMDKDFTSDIGELREALERIDSRGATALYDAVTGSLDHLRKGHRDKKVLLVITDGDDNASRKSFEFAVHAAQQSDALIYAVGLFSEEDLKRSKRMVRHSKKVLTTLAQSTGGLAYFPKDLNQVESICTQIAHDLRNQYLLGYYPTNTRKDGSFRAVKVDVIPPRGSGKLFARTRTGYYAQKASTSD